MDRETLRYPDARRTTVAESVGDVGFDDPYRWLEDDSPEALAWQERQNELTLRYIRAWPHVGALRSAVARFAVDDRLSPPVRAGGRWFERFFPDGAERAALRVSDEPCGPGRVILDSNRLADDRRGALDWFSPSPDGRLVVCALSRVGGERSEIVVLDVDSGTIASEELPYVFDRGGVAWLPDSSAFYATPLDPRTDAYEYAVFLHRVGEPPPADPEPVSIPPFTVPMVAGQGRFALLYSFHEAGEFAKPIFVKDLVGDGPWRPFLAGVPASFDGVLVGDEYVAITNEGAPNGRVVAVPVDAEGDRDTWREILPESDAVLRSVSWRGGFLVLEELVDTCARVRMLELDGRVVGELPLPDRGALVSGSPAGRMAGDPESRDYVFVFTSFTTAPAVHRFDLATRTLESLTKPAAELSGTATRLERCTSADGTPVTYHLVHREDLDLGHPAPALIYGYGGFNHAFSPVFLGSMGLAAFVEAGGIYVHANLRGGAEHGEAFRQSGRLRHKQNTFHDLYAIAEDLVRRGLSSAELLGVMGGSNGGLLAATAATQRPDLFAVCVAWVPILDLIRAATDSYGLYGVRVDYGDPLDPEGVRHLLGFSPYHNVREGTAYPAVLFECGSADPRCPPWHGRKTAARMQHATSSGQPVLLHVWPDVGHGSNSDQTTRIDQSTEWLAFVMERLEMTPGAAPD